VRLVVEFDEEKMDTLREWKLNLMGNGGHGAVKKNEGHTITWHGATYLRLCLE